MIGVLKYTAMFIGAVLLLLFAIGMMFTAFHSQPVTDYVEEALEEVTRKRGKRK